MFYIYMYAGRLKVTKRQSKGTRGTGSRNFLINILNHSYDRIRLVFWAACFPRLACICERHVICGGHVIDGFTSFRIGYSTKGEILIFTQGHRPVRYFSIIAKCVLF